MHNDEDLAFERSSGNVFADLGLENAAELLARADLASAIVGIIRRNGWTQAEAAERAGLTQPEVSLISRAKTEKFSMARLQDVLRQLGVDVEISLHRRENGGIGTLRVREYA
jgi:predicted XRE-type DNA-binding protein